MTMERQDILTGFYEGNYKEIHHVCFEADEVTRKNLTSAEIVYAIFSDASEIILYKTSANGASEIEITDALQGESKIILLPADTLHLHGSWRHHINIVDSNGHEETVSSGKINIFRSFARRPRASSISAYLVGG